MTRRAALGVGLLVVPVVALGQGRPLQADAVAATVLVHGAGPSGASTWRGVVAGGEGRASAGRFALEAGYGQGTLRDDGAADSPTVDFTAAFAHLAVRVLPGLEVLLGPRARAYAGAGTPERWTEWDGGLRYRRPMGVPWLIAGAELAGAFAGSANVPGAFDGGRGGAASLQLLLGPVALRVRYAIDEARFASGARSRTVEELGLSVGVGLP